jgi:hypothetical protein
MGKKKLPGRTTTSIVVWHQCGSFTAPSGGILSKHNSQIEKKLHTKATESTATVSYNGKAKRRRKHHNHGNARDIRGDAGSFSVTLWTCKINQSRAIKGNAGSFSVNNTPQ